MPENFNKSDMNSNQVTEPGGLVENVAFSTSFDGIGYETFETISGDSIWLQESLLPKRNGFSIFNSYDDENNTVGVNFDMGG